MKSDSALADLRAALEEEQAKLIQQLSELGFGDAASLSFDQNFADSSQVTAERAEVEVLGQSLQDTLTEVRTALAKLDEGTYGVCEECQQAITVARLEAKPAAPLCIDCASKR
ncbi:MAG: TraR/DksA family transcriptional regulator [Actinomycetota bacterium]|nr:TraR/DksA family transcriptional regulator [Actinomycetota bacterium]